MEKIDNKARIFDEAAKQFQANGYRATTNVTIANAIDVAPTMINHFFRSKAGLYREIFGFDPIDEDAGKYLAMILSAIRTAAESGDRILQDPTFVNMLGAILDDQGIPKIGFSPQHAGEDGAAYIARQFEGFNRATSEAIQCDICRGFFWKEDLCVGDVDLGTTHLACNNSGPVVDLGTGDPIEGAVIEDCSYKFGEDGL